MPCALKASTKTKRKITFSFLSDCNSNVCNCIGCKNDSDNIAIAQKNTKNKKKILSENEEEENERGKVNAKCTHAILMMLYMGLLCTRRMCSYALVHAYMHICCCSIALLVIFWWWMRLWLHQQHTAVWNWWPKRNEIATRKI